jgi:hypothetical protein
MCRLSYKYGDTSLYFCQKGLAVGNHQASKGKGLSSFWIMMASSKRRSPEYTPQVMTHPNAAPYTCKSKERSGCTRLARARTTEAPCWGRKREIRKPLSPLNRFLDSTLATHAQDSLGQGDVLFALARFEQALVHLGGSSWAHCVQDRNLRQDATHVRTAQTCRRSGCRFRTSPSSGSH